MTHLCSFLLFKFDHKIGLARVVYAKTEISEFAWVMTQNWASQIENSI